MFIKKMIPFGTGLGGGSSDAAVVLVGLNKLYSTNFDFDILGKFQLKLRQLFLFFFVTN
ncbi:MAG: hypothetical protein ACRC42_01925 [Mycoplasma sp.]